MAITAFPCAHPNLNGLTALASVQGFRVSAVAEDARLAWESAAADQRIPLALSDCLMWHTMSLGPTSTFCTIHDHREILTGAFAIQRHASNALGHRILRLERLGEGIPEGAEPATVAALLMLGQQTQRVLRLVAELHDRASVRRARMAEALQAAGFHRKEAVRTYERTLVIDVQRDDKALLASFAPQARQRLRLAERSALSVVSIEDEALLPQLEPIHRETYARTGGHAPEQDWPRIVAAARDTPDRLRIFGVMLNESGSERLVAYARALRHGTFVVYDAAGSTRLADRRIPLMYPVIWALIRWARDTGATWLDLGGITVGSAENDPLAGISEFKRKFGGDELVVGEEWHLDVAPVRQRVIQTAGKVLEYLKRGR